MHEPLIRLYRSEDRAPLLASIHDLQEYERALHQSRRPGGEIAELYLSRLLQWTAERSGAIFVAEIHASFVGFLACWIIREESLLETPDFAVCGYVSDIQVSPEHRGKGLASRLLETAERYLAGSGITRLRLSVLASNASALAAYRKYGFEPYEISFDKRITLPPSD